MQRKPETSTLVCSNPASDELSRLDPCLRETIEARLRRIPIKYQSARLEHLPVSLVEALTSIETGVYLWGGTGTGKTYAAWAMMRELLSRTAWESNVRCYRFDKFLMELKDGFSKNKSEKETLQRLLDKAVMLILDDVGIADSDYAGRILLHVMDEFIDAGRKIIITSNLSPENFETTFGQRIGSRIHLLDIIKLSGQDRRKTGRP